MATIPPAQGIFFNGQIFDAYAFVASLIRKAKSSILLVDNYVNESVLLLLAKRHASTSATIFTRKISRQLALDLEKHTTPNTHPSRSIPSRASTTGSSSQTSRTSTTSEPP